MPNAVVPFIPSLFRNEKRIIPSPDFDSALRIMSCPNKKIYDSLRVPENPV